MLTESGNGKVNRAFGMIEEILITGGAGFIGSHLTDTLLRSGNRVICVDNFELGTRDNLKEVLKRADFIPT